MRETRRNFLTGGMLAAGAVAGAGVNELVRGGLRSDSPETLANEARLKREGVLQDQTFEISALLERVSVLLKSLRDMLKSGIDHNPEEQRLFNLGLGKLLEVADNLRYKDLNYRTPLLDIKKPIDAGGHLIPSQEIKKVDDVTSEVQQFLGNLTEKYPAYGEDSELMEIMTGDVQAKS
jgi:hypothetical protein